MSAMFEPTDTPLPEAVEHFDPYGDVALGVECAWPVSLPEAQAAAANED
jgi:hypothetical protein